MMNIFASVFAYLIIIVPSSLLVLDLKCSHRSHWIQRAKERCERNESYHCLYDTNTRSLKEDCFKPEDLPPGYHSVISGRLHVKQCADNHFSPHISWSNDSFECQYHKSICSEEGQIVVDNGSSTKDIKCRCDYRKGYAFILTPKDTCICSPSVEDCSCHLVHCQNSSSILSQDYVCLKQDKMSTLMKCPTIENDRKSDSNEERKADTSVPSFSDLHPRKFNLICIIGVALVCLMGVGFILWSISTERKSEEEHILKNVLKLSVFPDLQNAIDKASLVVLTGREGTGKTTIAKCLHGRYRKKYCNIIRIRKAVLKYDMSEIRYIIVDSRGKVSDFNKSIRTYLIHIKATKLIIVEDIPPNLNIVLKEFDNQAKVIFDLDDKDFYKSIDKENILKLHMKMNYIYSEDEMSNSQSLVASEAVCVEKSLFADLLSEESLLGFPTMCASFCSHKDHIRQGITYFWQPPAPLITKLDELRKKGDSDDLSAFQYCLCVSVLLSFKNNIILANDDFEPLITENMRHIFPDRSVSNLHLVQIIAFHMMPHYFESSKSELKFSHHKIYQAVLITYCNTHPKPMFDKCNICDIILFLRPPNYQPLHDEMVLTVDYTNSDFVTRVTSSLMCKNVTANDIKEEKEKSSITIYGETHILQLIVNYIKSNQTYTHHFRLRFFREFEVYARMLKNEFNVKLYAYCLAWKYVSIKKEENEDELNTFKDKICACDSDVIVKVLQTLVDKFGNTLLHYFVIWNGKLEKNIIDTLLSSAKENEDEQGIADVWEFSNLENLRNHTPLHFAVFFGRNDLIDNFITMKEIARGKETWLYSLYVNVRKMFSNEKENLMRLLESGMNHILVDVKSDKDMSILFETELIPSQSAITFGEKKEFDHIMSILQDRI